jgi:galactokinase
MRSEELALLFSQRYGKQCRLFYAPGRVNLIGEHTDYNEGLVLPFALDHGTTVAAAPRSDRRIRVHSLNRSESAEFDLDAPAESHRGMWLDYVEGMARSLEADVLTLRGADLMIHSDVPLGGGLSSSAALEISVGLALCGVSDDHAGSMVLVKTAHKAETEFVGTQSGIMDPYVAMFGQENSCLLIDCRSLECRSIPMVLGDLAIIISDTGVKHALSSSEYNFRREECRQALAIIRAHVHTVESLRDLDPERFATLQGYLPVPLRNRCRHVITENVRTLRAVRALEQRDFGSLGRLMTESHLSLRFDYEVSSPELDILVEAAQKQRGVLGSRMTGGGFGGCTITLLEESAVDAFSESLSRVYHQNFGRIPAFRYAKPGMGAREITL